MSEPDLRLTFRGVRGSLPTTEAENSGFGGNTACLDIAVNAKRRLLIDCGSGMRFVPPATDSGSGGDGIAFDVLLTHYHIDHLLGLPFFPPLYDSRSRFTFYGFGWHGLPVRKLLEEAIRPPWFPVSLRDTPCSKAYVDLDGTRLEAGGVHIRCARLNHPQGVTAFRLEGARRSVVLATDYERGDPQSDGRLRELAMGADVLIHDAQYTPAEYDARYRGWGHSTWEHAVEAARDVEASRLILFHHDPDRSDEELSSIVGEARARFSEVEAAREGGQIEI